ncbi:hypothetical protein CAC42_2819 [Sphaceloma murrayae]|uniref:Uncharacterized protein n=1 Tax=Sphaceloma murrayae TaxID=2082308 RepID=A0A2K1R0R3_9PEZI|nr:hypothetical protein CAC42_2819 [Sphaceloma murrayae]
MSLARALTTRRKEEPAAPPAYVGRAASQRAPNAKPIKRSEISLPVALISTTNMLSYEAPDIIDAPHVSDMGGRYFSSNQSVASSSPSVSGEDSDLSGSIHSHDTDATSVDMSSPDLSLGEANHLSEYFKSSSGQRSTGSTVSSRVSRSTTHSHSSRPSMDSNSPRVPSRAPSHSKTAHMLSHKRSVQRMATIPSEARTRDSFDMFSAHAVNSSAPAPVSHPFGNELAQLNEAAEEFGHAVRDAEADADLQIMRSKGLVQFCANDYMSEISSLYSSVFEEDMSTYQPMIWI